MNKYITDHIRYVGVDDTTLDLFESQYIIPDGISYNSYLILDEKTAVMDSVDRRKCEEWLENVESALEGRALDYLVVHHMEPDHTGSIAQLASRHPQMQIVVSSRALQMMPQFFHEAEFLSRTIGVKEGDTLSLGRHTLQFMMAPMVHWPEVMVSYEKKDRTLFSADAFGKFGALSHEDEWACEARRYYFNICGKYGVQVQALLDKAAAVEIDRICPLHGPVLSEDLGYYISLYKTWSSYEPEEKGVFVAYASIHGGTAAAAMKMADILKEKGEENVVVADLCRYDMAEAVEYAFRFDRLVVAAASYDSNVFPAMHDFLHHLALKNYQKRRVGIIENGSWAPTAGRIMRGMLEQMKEIEIVGPMVTVRSRMKPDDVLRMSELADALTD